MHVKKQKINDKEQASFSLVNHRDKLWYKFFSIDDLPCLRFADWQIWSSASRQNEQQWLTSLLSYVKNCGIFAKAVIFGKSQRRRTKSSMFFTTSVI